MARYYVETTYIVTLGQVSEILDRESSRRILVSGKDHKAQAQRRADEMNKAVSR